MTDETQQLGKCFPTKIVSFQMEKSALDHKSSKKRITVLHSANAASLNTVKVCIMAMFRKHTPSQAFQQQS